MARDANGVVVGEVEATAASPRLSVRPGRYFVRGRAKDHLLEGEVDVAAGATKTVAPSDLTQVAYARLVRKGVGVRTISHAVEAGATLRTRIANARTPCWGGAVGYRLDLPTFSAGLRLGACHSSFQNRILTAATNEFSAALELRHSWDFAKLSPFVALSLGATLTHQSFDAAQIDARVSTSPLGALGGGVVVPVWDRYFVGLEGLAELQLIRLQTSGFEQPSLGWAFAPRGFIVVGFQL
jgi:hypothetical protein